MSTPKIAFEKQPITLALDKILPVRFIKDPEKNVSRYSAIVSSIREIGVIEPLMVYPQKKSEGLYLLMDGHLRLTHSGNFVSPRLNAWSPLMTKASPTMPVSAGSPRYRSMP